MNVSHLNKVKTLSYCRHLSIFFGLALSACGGGGGDAGTGGPTPPPPTPPSIDLTVALHSEVSEEVRFSATVQNPAGLTLQYIWDFGDGQTSTLEAPTHAYQKTGDYVVSLTLNSAAGKTSKSTHTQIGYFSGINGLKCTGAIDLEGWCRQSHTPTAQHINALSMVGNSGWALDAQGAIFRTENGGTTWAPRPALPAGVYTRLAAVDRLTAWVGSTGGKLAQTSDGGAGWHEFQLPRSVSITALAAYDKNTLWVLSYFGDIYKTVDGGATWTSQRIADVLPTSVSVVDANTVWIAGPQGVARTTDGGTNWKPVPGTRYNVNAIQAIDANSAWISTIGAIQKTTDAGATWTTMLSSVIQSPGLSVQFNSVTSVGKDIVYVADHYGNIVKSSDGGISWKSQTPLPACENSSPCKPALNVIVAIDEKHVIAAGDKGGVFTTSDGETWKTVNSGIPVVSGNSPVFPMLDTNPTNNAIYLGNTGYSTNNGGLSWTLIQAKNNSCGSFTQRLNPSTVIMVGCGYGVSLSKDGGLNWAWSPVFGTSLSGLSISVPKENVAWAVAHDFYSTSGVAVTKDGAASWQANNTVANARLYSVAGVDENIAWAGGEKGLIMRTADAGKTWTTLRSDSTDFISNIAAQDGQKAWAVSANQSVIMTQDGGASWVPRNKGISGAMYTVATLDGKNLWAAGEKGKIFRSDDSGVSWKAQESGTTEDLRYIRIIDNSTVWITGDNSTILKTVTGGK